MASTMKHIIGDQRGSEAARQRGSEAARQRGSEAARATDLRVNNAATLLLLSMLASVRMECSAVLSLAVFPSMAAAPSDAPVMSFFAKSGPSAMHSAAVIDRASPAHDTSLTKAVFILPCQT